MIERITFEMSGLIKDKSNKAEIEFWGHDAGEFVYENIEELLTEAETEDPAEISIEGVEQ